MEVPPALSMDCHPPQAASTQGKLLVAVVVVEQAVGLAVGQVEAKSLLEAAALALLLAQCRSPMV